MLSIYLSGLCYISKYVPCIGQKVNIILKQFYDSIYFVKFCKHLITAGTRTQCCISVSQHMKVGYMTVPACQMVPTNNTHFAPELPYWACIRTRGTVLGQATFLPPFLLALLVGATKLSCFNTWLCCYWLLSDIGVGQPGIFYCYRVAGSRQEDGEALHWVLGGSGK